MAPMTTRHALVETGLGALTVVMDGEHVVGIYFPGHWTLPDPETFGPRSEDDPVAKGVQRQLEEYLAGERTTFDLPLELRGSDLQQRVWSVLERIPYGTTTTYGAIAAEVGAPAQAVGNAVGANPLSVVVPCHRVVGSDGSLTGFAGGLERKRRLLALEEPDAEARGALF